MKRLERKKADPQKAKDPVHMRPGSFYVYLLTMNDVFISYTQPDRNEAFFIHDKLQANNLVSWIAVSKNNGIPTGHRFEGEIVKAITASKVFVLIYSQYCNESEEIIKEIRHRTKKQPTLIVRFDNSTFNEELSYHLKGLQHIVANRNNPNETANQVLLAVRAFIQQHRPSNTGSTDQLLFSNGLRLFGQRIYAEAERPLKQYLAIEPNNPEVRFYLALAIIGGRKTRKLDQRTTEELERILMPALGTEGGYINVLLAIIKEGYYASNGFRVTAPTIDELFDNLSSIDAAKAGDILTHIQEPENRIWKYLQSICNE
jgi:hypothetical protein